MAKYRHDMSEREDVMGRVRRPRIEDDEQPHDWNCDCGCNDDPLEDDTEGDDADGYEFFKENEGVFKRGF